MTVLANRLATAEVPARPPVLAIDSKPLCQQCFPSNAQVRMRLVGTLNAMDVTRHSHAAKTTRREVDSTYLSDAVGSSNRVALLFSPFNNSLSFTLAHAKLCAIRCHSGSHSFPVPWPITNRLLRSLAPRNWPRGHAKENQAQQERSLPTRSIPSIQELL